MRKDYLLKSALYFLLLFSFSSINAQVDSLKVVQYYQQGEQFLLKGKPAKAIKYFRKATVANSKMTAAWRALGTCNELLENYDSTLVQYKKAIDLNPNFSRIIYFEIGRVAYRNGQYQKALDYFYQFEKLQKNDIQQYGFNGEKEAKFEKNYIENLPSSIRECKAALELKNFSNVKIIENLGDSINTPFNEYFPYVSNNQELLFYTSSQFDKTDHNKTAMNENLLFSHKKGKWQKGKAVDNLITTNKNEGMSTFTRDGVKMIYTVCQQEGVLENSCDLRQAIMHEDSIISIEYVDGAANSEFWESQAALSCDGNTLFFASNRKGGVGQTDIWVSNRLENGTWSTPKNLGKNINTPSTEEAPFITNDGKTLFFSSTGHLGMGEQDIFMSHWNEKGYWEPATNLGPPINTVARELGFFLTSDNQTGYFSSDKKDGFGGMDIYKFQMPQQFEVAPTTFVEGFVKDSITLAPIQTIIETKERGRIETDKNGRFFFCLPSEKNLSIQIDKNGYLPFQNTTFIPKWENKNLYSIDLLLIPKSIPVATEQPIINPIIIKDTIESLLEPILHIVYFDFNEFGLNPEATKILDRLMVTLPNRQFSKVEVNGYSDVTGGWNYNLELSKRRAKNVARYLEINNINSKELVTLGEGEDSQFEKQQLNRRVEIRFY